MNAVLLRSDEALRSLPRWLPIGVLSATVLLGVVSFARHSDSWDLLNRPPWFAMLVAVVIWSAVAVFLISPGCYARCGDLALALPMSSRSLWLSHLIAVLLSGALILAVTCGIVGGGVSLLGRLPRRPMAALPDLVAIFGDLLVVLVVTVVLQQSREPQLSKLPDRWERDVVLLLGSFVLGALLVALPYYWALVPLVFAWITGLKTWRALPPAMSLTPDSAAADPARAGADGSGVAITIDAPARWREPGESPRRGIARFSLLYMTLYRTLAKKPVFGVLAAFFLFVFGMVLSGGIFDDGEMRISNIVMTAYILFALSAPWFTRLYLVDHLPIDRRRLFAFIMLPTLACLLCGYAMGAWLAAARLDTRELVEFRQEDCCHYVYVPIGACEFAQNGAPPPNVAPWGESHDAWTVPLYRDSRAVLYSPYSTPDGSSIEFVALQLSRATEAVYGTRIAPEEIEKRYLRVDASGRVGLGPEGLPLRQDYPHLQPRQAIPEFPFLFLPAGLLWMVLIGIYLRFYRPGVSDRMRKVAFGVLLAVTLLGHIVPFALVIAGFAEFRVLTGFFWIAARHFTAALPGGAVTVWGVMLMLVTGAYMMVQRRFLRLETSKIDFESGQCWM